MRRQEDLGGLASSMQAAALDPAHWEAALNAVNAFVGSEGAVLLTVQARQRITPASTGMAELIDDYFNAGWHLNDQREASVPLLKSRGIVCDHDFQSEAEIVGTDFYNDFLFRHRVKWFAGLGAAVDGDDWCLALQRSPESDPFGPKDLERLQVVRGLLCNAAHLSMNLGQSWVAGLSQALHLMNQAAIVFDSQARVLDANDLALSMVGKNIDVDRRLQFADGRSTSVFDAILTQALRVVEIGTGEAVCDIRLGATTCRCRATSLLRQENLIATKAAALVLITPIPVRSGDVLKRRFGLTNAELKVSVEMSKGRSVKQIAEGHQVKAETVRTQLKSIFDKTGTSSQAQLVAFIRDLSKEPEIT